MLAEPREFDSKYFSINTFMRYMMDKETAGSANQPSGEVEHIDVYFIPAHSYTNQFNNISIKAVALLIKQKGIIKSYKYNEMLEHLGFIPIISFKFNGDRRIYKKQPLQKLIIRNKLNEFQDKQFYSNKIMVVTDNGVIEKIKAALPEKKSIASDDEIELFD